MNDNSLLLLLLMADRVACFLKRGSRAWVREPIHGESWYPLPPEKGLPAVLDELDQRLHRADHLARFEIHFLYAQESVDRLADIGTHLARHDCHRWQVLRWEPLRDRAGTLAGVLADEPLPSDEWLHNHLLPILESTFQYHRDEFQTAEQTRAQRQHEETLESLRAERLRLQNDLIAMRDQLAALQQPSVETLVTFLPAIYRHVFGVISPHDLALLAGSMEVPATITSPWPEPSPDTLQMKQKALRRLPAADQKRLRDFCHRLPHKLDLRSEMRTWIGEE